MTTVRKRPPKIVLVVACSQRKRVPPPPDLRLGSLASGPEERATQWRKRLDEVEAGRQLATELYAGDHWHSACEAYRLARRYSGRAELWVISAGYGLIRSNTPIKPYGATFATGADDSVWRGQAEGDRHERLRHWWRTLGHQCALRDLLPARDDGAVVIVAGAAYLSALDGDLEAALQYDATGERVSVISAGSRSNRALLPVSDRFRAAVGGTDAALNARLLALLASEAESHRFTRSAMAAMLNRIAPQVPVTSRHAGTPMTDERIARQIQAIRRELPHISRTEALREFRSDGMACEQARFASIWSRS